MAYFSNLALAKLVAVCVKAGKLLGRRVLTICTPHWAPRWGCPGWQPAPGRAGGSRSQSVGPGISSRDRACCSWCGTSGRKIDTDRVSHLHRENEHNEHVTFSVINARCDTYQYVSSCAYSRWIYHIEFSHKSDTPFFLLGFPCLQFATFACNNTAAFEPTKDQHYKNLFYQSNSCSLHWHWPWWHFEGCWGRVLVARPRVRLLRLRRRWMRSAWGRWPPHSWGCSRLASACGLRWPGLRPAGQRWRTWGQSRRSDQAWCPDQPPWPRQSASLTGHWCSEACGPQSPLQSLASDSAWTRTLYWATHCCPPQGSQAQRPESFRNIFWTNPGSHEDRRSNCH